MEQKEKEKCLQVIDILEQNEELKAFMVYNKDYFNDLKKKLNDNFYHSAAHFYRSLTLRFFRPENGFFRTLIASFHCLCDNIVMNNFGNSFVHFARINDYNYDYDGAAKNLHYFYVNLKKQELVDNFRNYINETINLVKNGTKSEDHLKMKKLTNQTDNFSEKILYTCKTFYTESSRLKDIKLMRQECISKRRRKYIWNFLNRQQQQYSTLTNIETDLHIYYPESKEPSTEALPLLW